VKRVLRVLAALAALAFAGLIYLYVTLPDVRVLAKTNPTTTAFMQLREQEAARKGKTLRHLQRWVPYNQISGNLKRAVLVAEDDAFWQHEGVDIEQLKLSIQRDLEAGKGVRGGSTITQQLAKNLYLSPSRNPLRKLRELIIARRLEAELTKIRIFEIYLNVIEWGDGIWGADAAARAYFGTSAGSLSPDQAALLAGAIINPRRYSPAHPNTRLLRRQRIIRARMGGVETTPTTEVRQAAAPATPPPEAAAPDDAQSSLDEPDAEAEAASDEP
jgi:monofunctional biosynthetic peptidoglycan transglycosylase